MLKICFLIGVRIAFVLAVFLGIRKAMKDHEV